MNRINQFIGQLARYATKAASLAFFFACANQGSETLFAQSWHALKELPPLPSYIGSASGIFNSAATTGPDGKVYVVGGQLNGGYAITVVNRYDPVQNVWDQPAQLNTGRMFHAAVAGCDGKIYAIGGNVGGTPHPPVLASVETFDPVAATWTTLPQSAWLQKSRDHLMAAVGGDCRIYAFSTDSAYPAVEMQVFDGATWTYSLTGFNETELYGAYTSQDGNIYVLGASGGHFFNGTAWNSTAVLYPFLNFASTLGVDGRVYLMGQSPYETGSSTLSPSALSFTPAGMMIWGQYNYGHKGTAAAAEGQVISVNGLRDQYAGQSNVEGYGPLKAAVGPYKVWWQFNNATAIGDDPKSFSDPTACLFSPGLSGANRVTGRVGYAALFNPAIPSGQNIHLVNQPGCADIGAQDFSIEFWMKHNGTATSAVQSILDKRSTEYYGSGYHVGLYNGRIVLQTASGGSTMNFWTPPSAAITPNQWTHIAITVSRSVNGGKIWLNGVLAVQFTPPSGTLSSPTRVLNIGGHNFSTGAPYQFQGQLDELTMYNRALTFQEVRSIFLAGGQGKQ